MRHPSVLLASALLAVMLAPPVGCVRRGQYDKVRLELTSSHDQIRELQADNDTLRRALTKRDSQIHTLQSLGHKRLEKLAQVARIELGRYSTGVDLDDRSGDDAVKVYLCPIDEDGDVVKAVGAVKIRLYDLAAGAGETSLGEYDWSVDQAMKQWSSALISDHFRLICPWKSARPKHDEITVRAEFTDYLTGKTFTAQRLCKIRLPAPKGTQIETGEK